MIKAEKLVNSNLKAVLYEDSPSFSGIVAGECKGLLWVDDIKDPSIALAYSSAVGGYCILGEPQNESVYKLFYDFLIKDLFPDLRKKNEYCFEFSTECLSIQEYMLKMFSDRIIESEDEFFYRKAMKNETNIKIPDEYLIVKVDAEFVKCIEQGEYINEKFVENRILESWGSYHNFLSKSVAFVVLHQKRIVAVIVGTARFHNIIPIDIETEEEHRRKGLASLMTQCFVNECVDNQLIAQWDCVDSNVASKKAAQKAGFVLMKKKPYFWFTI
jgi:hypothetical protein